MAWIAVYTGNPIDPSGETVREQDHDEREPYGGACRQPLPHPLMPDDDVGERRQVLRPAGWNPGAGRIGPFLVDTGQGVRLGRDVLDELVECRELLHGGPGELEPAGIRALLGAGDRDLGVRYGPPFQSAGLDSRSVGNLRERRQRDATENIQ